MRLNLKVATLGVALAGAAAMPAPANACQMGPIPLINMLVGCVPSYNPGQAYGFPGYRHYGYRRMREPRRRIDLARRDAEVLGVDPRGYRGDRRTFEPVPAGCIDRRRHDPLTHRTYVDVECP